MKLYYPENLYNKNYRGQLFPLLKPFIKKENFSDLQRQQLYGVSEEDYKLVDSSKDADVVVLPMAWNYYVNNKQLKEAYQFIREAAKDNKMVWSWNAGDYGVKIRDFNNLKVFRMSGYTSNLYQGHEGMPVFIQDRLQEYKQQDHVQIEYTHKPVVGFCGQANASIFNSYWEKLKIATKNLQSYLGLSAKEPQAILSSTRLRANLLSKLSKSNLITDQFILRQKYRAGVKTKAEKEKTTHEFYQNINDSQYVLCVRGAGNFSVRFYETLMMGRIPVYIHTDGYLPLANKIDWKKHVVWVDGKNLNQVDKILGNFHRKIDEDQLLDLCKKNRELWEKHLTLDGFFKSYYQMNLK
ncbi:MULTISPECIES: exostosin domain-containing protein [Mesonia]|uniref:Uncharacterized protein n=1 Tax=Mesonia oceanica TaxID=2687242 RepID=A0AC61YA64_9FLAO|nr:MULTISPECIES: exostosin family protein [Mesonia]MAN26657.1 hypothetical protein [Mesonia sp.]MAQ40066.1 hypothetical protein [Mesonia sp.]MBJ96632.1 hypothetical protein [Flavobacteriaceae bacterium]VVV01326.1 hypothetical protein FVB9532_02616 [Mesonia oceanica]|tara:strand:+ start:388 stop:1446 length:1059 start_codon:yes stop_codon:yes gene_type:complete